MDGEYQEYPYRYIIVVLFSLPSFINGMCWVVLSPISSKIAESYQVSDSLVTLIPMLYMVMYVFVNFPSNWILDSKGIRKGVIIGAVMTALGSGIRCMINLSFTFAIVGQFFCAVGQPFILNAPAKIATYWFKEQNRPVATAILSVINIVGTGIGFVVPSIIVDETEMDKEKTHTQVLLLMAIEFGLSFVGALLVVLLFREKPPKPPSFGAESVKIPFKKSLYVMMNNKSFLWLLLAFSVTNGVFNFFGSLLNLLLKPFNYTDDQTSLIGGLLIGIGIFSSFFLSLYVEKTDKYKRVLIFCALLAIASLLLLTFNLYYIQLYWVLIVATLLLGTGLTPLMPLSFDFGCETMFPVGEAQITGILMTGGQIVGIIEIVLVQQVYGIENDERGKEKAFYSSIFIAVILALGSIGYLMVKEDLKRKNQEHAKSQHSSLISSVAV